MEPTEKRKKSKNKIERFTIAPLFLRGDYTATIKINGVERTTASTLRPAKLGYTIQRFDLVLRKGVYV